MAPRGGGKDGVVRTVGCAFAKLMPDEAHRDAILSAVQRTHKATILLTELLNMHVRRLLTSSTDADLSCFFSSNWLLRAYNEVTKGSDRASSIPELKTTCTQHMPPFVPPDRTGLVQCLGYEAINLATVASNNVFMHFNKRVLSFVRTRHALDEAAYKALSKDERRVRKLALMQVASDVCRIPGEARRSPAEWHAQVAALRTELRIDTAVGDWDDKPLLYHLKARPHRFLRSMAHMSTYLEGAERRAFALFPLRRTCVPRHVRFDDNALRRVLKLGESEHTNRRKSEVWKQRKESGSLTAAAAEPAKRTRRSPEEMREEKQQLFSQLVDLRAAGVKRAHSFDFAFTTDGVCARVQLLSPKPETKKRKRGDKGPVDLSTRREYWTIDALKCERRVEQLHVVGLDPGKRELVVAVDMDDPKACTPVRYTLAQRKRDMRSVQYANESKEGKPKAVTQHEAELAGFHSRSADLGRFCAYCAKRHERLDECLAFYGDIGHRRRRFKTYIKTQQSEQRLYDRLNAMHDHTKDRRELVLAYGSWGLVAGRAGAACNRGTPPCIGVGLMRKLAQRFTVVLTPEAYTSKTCCRCLGPCGPWEEKENEMGKKIRGLRRCQNEECMRPLNRDKNGATNIGTNFKRLMRDQGPIRAMTDEDLEFHRATLCCLECNE